jgi:S1-C subfamily serine protease
MTEREVIDTMYRKIFPILAIIALAGCGSEEPEAPAPAPVAKKSIAKPAPAQSEVSKPVNSPAMTPEEIVDQLKDATVYIKTLVAGRTISTGTGYVIQRNSLGNAWIATNRHVAT